MKIGIIGANGRQGRLLCREAKKRNHTVYAIIRSCQSLEPVDKVIQKSLFEITNEDIQDLDVLISAFGSGFEIDPKINREAINHLANLVKDTSIHLLIVGGAGCLYTDSSHKIHTYEDPHHPAFLKEISKNICLGLQDLKGYSHVNFTFVCPSLFFDFEGVRTGEYQVGITEEVLYSKKQESRISYEDFAIAMLDEAENKKYIGKCITICEV